jgi:hypothetical protein
MNRLQIKLSPAVFALTFLPVLPGPCLAQNTDPDQAFLPSQVWSISTVPANGDQNPYGVVFVPGNFPVGSGPLHHGDILVSNFNNAKNLQGTGTTIVDISQAGVQSLFFQGKAPLGLTTALGTLRAGFIIVGNGPTKDGSSGTAKPGSLLVINNQGRLVQSIADGTIQYPWDMALIDNGDSAIAFITNALTGAVTRLNFSVSSSGLTLKKSKTIASGYVHRGDLVSLFVSPTGLVYDPGQDVLYVASTGDNAVYAIGNAAGRQTDDGLGRLIYEDDVHLHGALGMILAPNGHFLVTNNDTINPNPKMPSEIVEFTVDGQFVKEISVDPAFGGSFGLAARVGRNFPILAAVDDNTATIDIWHISEGRN